MLALLIAKAEMKVDLINMFHVESSKICYFLKYLLR